MLLTHLSPLAMAERSYLDLGSMVTKNKGFLRKDVSITFDLSFIYFLLLFYNTYFSLRDVYCHESCYIIFLELLAVYV